MIRLTAKPGRKSLRITIAKAASSVAPRTCCMKLPAPFFTKISFEQRGLFDDSSFDRIKAGQANRRRVDVPTQVSQVG